MAVGYTLEGGDLGPQIVFKTIKNAEQMITDGILTAANYDLSLTANLPSFRRKVNVMFAQFATDVVGYTVTSTFGSGDSWYDMRALINAEFAAIDAIVNP